MPFSGEIWEDEVDICSRLILKAVLRASRQRDVCITSVILHNLSSLNQTHKSYKEDTDFNFIFIQGLVMLLRVLFDHPRSYNIVFKYLYKLTSI